jgi:hypothetical protein
VLLVLLLKNLLVLAGDCRSRACKFCDCDVGESNREGERECLEGVCCGWALCGQW